MKSSAEQTGEKASLPFGKVYLASLRLHEQQKFDTLDAGLGKDSQTDFALLGTALSVTYQLGTCHRGCRGGDHVLESLVGRANNLGSAAFLLITNGYYDESLCLVRSAGEIANLIMLFFTMPEKYGEWVSATKQEHIDNFGPGQVRWHLGQKGMTPMRGSWYAELCEKAAHVSPATVPNLHNNSGQGYVGGVHQAEGFRDCVEQLAMIMTSIAMISAIMLGQRDLYDEVVREAQSAAKPS